MSMSVSMGVRAGWLDMAPHDSRVGPLPRRWESRPIALHVESCDLRSVASKMPRRDAVPRFRLAARPGTHAQPARREPRGLAVSASSGSSFVKRAYSPFDPS
jgi:hypothetical protein